MFRNAFLRTALAAALTLACLPPALAQISFIGAASSSAVPPAPALRAASSGTLTTPAFRAANSAETTTGTTLTITKPAGTAANDILIASIGIRPIASTITPPAGWTLIRRSDNGTANANSLAVYWKLATAAEPATYVFTIGGGFTHSSGGIMAFSNVDTVTPFDVAGESGQNVASGTSFATPAVTKTVANATATTILVGSWSFASASVWTQPAGFTIGFQTCAGGTTGGPPPATTCPANLSGDTAVGQATLGAWLTSGTRGSSGALTATVADNGDVGNTDLIALKPVLRITAPAGVTTNDQMIASIAVQPSTATVATPAGWTLVRRVNQATATSNSLVIFRKTATAAEPAFYEWSVSGADFAVGGIQAFSGVNTTTPVDLENGQAVASGTSFATPTITTTGPNEMIVTAHTIASATTFTPPAGMTENFDQASGAAAAAGQTVEGNSGLVQAAPAATGAQTATAAANADTGATEILALNPSGPGTLTIAVPAGTLANHVMVASVAVSPSTAVVTTPTGWTLQRTQANASATTNTLYVYYRVASASEPASYDWAISGFVYAAGGIQTFSGVNTTTPINVENAQNTNSLNIATPTVNTTVANTMLVTSHAYAAAGTFTPPAGMTEAYDVAALTPNNALGISIEGNFVAQAGIGATGAKTATASANSDRGNADILALQTLASPNGAAPFNAFETATAPNPGAITGKIFTKLAGTAFSLDVIALLGGAQYTAFTNVVAVDLVTGTTLGANNCPTVGLTSVLTVSPNPTIVSGRSTVSFPASATAYRDVRVRIRFPAGAPTITACSSDNFSIRPMGFTVSSTTATQTGSSGSPTIKAGANFDLTATSVAGYDGTPSINAANIVGSTVAGTIGGSFGAAPVGTGTATGASFTYSEVGNFGLNANAVFDSTFTAVDNPSDCTADFSNVPVGGKYGCSFGSAAIPQTTGTSGFGRFIPDHFTLVAASTLTNRSAAACSPVSTFSYLGEDMALAFTLQAQNSGNGITQNYAGAYAKLVPATSAQLGFGAVSGATPLTSRIAVSSSAGSFTAGQAAITAALNVTRAVSGSPDGPFATAKVGIAPNDSDSTQLPAAALNIDVDGVGGNDHAQIGGNTEFRFGIMKLGNAIGSQLLDLPISLQTQYWTGTGFSVNALDSCTVILLTNVSFPTYYGGLSAANMPGGNVTGNPVGTAGKFASGVGNLVVKKPTASATGAVDVQISLTAEAKTYLQLKRTTPPGTYTQDPLGRAAFGMYGSQPSNYIYFRENF